MRERGERREKNQTLNESCGAFIEMPKITSSLPLRVTKLGGGGGGGGGGGEGGGLIWATQCVKLQESLTFWLLQGTRK